MKAAVVDIGSNTVKMKIFSYKNNDLQEIFSLVNNARLISNITPEGYLSEEGIMLLCNVLISFKKEAERFSPDVFTAFATASLRRTGNFEVIKKTVQDFCGIEIDLVSGADEAFYSFSGVKNTMSDFPAEALLIDMGGGSTELVICNNGLKDCAESMNFGSLSLYLEHSKNGFDSMKAYASKCALNTSLPQIQTDHAVLVGGTALAINTLYMHFFPDSLTYTMTKDNLEAIYGKLKPYDGGVQDLLKEKVPHRITTVIPGLAAYLGIFDTYGVKHITVSTAGIREGYFFEKLLKEKK